MEPVVLRAGFEGLSLLWFLSLQVQGNLYWNWEGVRVGGVLGSGSAGWKLLSW